VSFPASCVGHHAIALPPPHPHWSVLEEVFAAIVAEGPPPPPPTAAASGGAGSHDADAEPEPGAGMDRVAGAGDDHVAPASPAEGSSVGVGSKRKRSEVGAVSASGAEFDVEEATPSHKRLRPSPAADVEGDDMPFDMKRFILDALAAAGAGEDDGGDGVCRVKLKRLRKAALEAAVSGRGLEGVDTSSASAAFEKRLAKLERKGRVVLDGSRKFVQLVPPPAAGPE